MTHDFEDDPLDSRNGNDAEDNSRSLSQSFGAYQTASPEDYRRVLTNGLVVLDTSCLLNLYRYTPEARKDFIAAMSKLGDNLWIPNQVVREFWLNREHVALEAASLSNTTLNSLEQVHEKGRIEIRSWGRRVSLPEDRIYSLESILSKAIGDIQHKITELGSRADLSGAKDTGHDPVLRELDSILAKKIGPPLASEDLQLALTEATRRISNKIPPGYKDRRKSDDKIFGDYIIWEQTIREVERRSVDVLFVTGDVKEDWWRITRGELRGPRAELYDELASRTGRRLLMARPDSLLRHVSTLLDLPVSYSSVDNIMTVEEVDNEVTGNTTRRKNASEVERNISTSGSNNEKRKDQSVQHKRIRPTVGCTCARSADDDRLLQTPFKKWRRNQVGGTRKLWYLHFRSGQ